MCKLEESVFGINIPVLRYGSTLLMLTDFYLLLNDVVGFVGV